MNPTMEQAPPQSIPTTPEMGKPTETVGPKTTQVNGAMTGLTDREGLFFKIPELQSTDSTLLESLTHANDAQAGKEGTTYNKETGMFTWTDENGASHDGNILNLVPKIIEAGNNIPETSEFYPEAFKHIGVIEQTTLLYVEGAEKPLSYQEWSTLENKPTILKVELDPNRLPDPPVEKTQPEAAPTTPKTPEEIKTAGYARAEESRKKYIGWRNVRNGEIVIDPTNREMNEYWIKQVDRMVLNGLDISNVDAASALQILNIDRTHNQRLIQLGLRIEQNSTLRDRYKNNPNIQAAIDAARADEAFFDKFYESIEEKFDKTAVEAEFMKDGKLSRENEQKIFLDTFDTLQKEAADIEKQSDKIEDNKLFKYRNIQFTKSGMMTAGKNFAFAMGIAGYLLYQDAENQEKQGQNRMGH